MAEPTGPSIETRPRYRMLLEELTRTALSAENVREILLRVRDLLPPLLDAERATIFAIDTKAQELYSLVRTDGEPVVLRVAKNHHTIAGHVALSRETLVVRDACDPEELRTLHPDLRHDPRPDQGAGLHTRQVLSVPLQGEDLLLGVLQFVNSKDGADFQRNDVVLAEEIARVLSSAFLRHFRAPKKPPTVAPPPQAPSPQAPANPSSQPPPSSPAARAFAPVPTAARLPLSTMRPPRTQTDIAAITVERLVALLDPSYENTRDDDEEELPVGTGPDATIARIVRQLVLEASDRGASDVHVEPNGPREPCRIRMRIDGDCTEVVTLPPGHRAALVQRVKILADLDITERRKPQDGRFRVRGPQGPIEVRVATIPTLGENEDVVLRILSSWKHVPLEDLGLSEANLKAFRAMVRSPYGIVLAVGPTGSGKTTTLHAALAHINTPDMKVLTAEDPIEIVQPGLRQVQVNTRIGLGFPELLRAFLRQDPDAIMIGEMRDHVTADTAVEASLTGHLVFSTLQANSAPETITRLLDMNIDRVSFADALRGVVAQRLIKRLCGRCREAYAPDDDAWAALARAFGEGFHARFPREGTLLQRAVGCDQCRGTGYRGRLAIHELLPGDDRTKALIRARASMDELRASMVAEGLLSLMQDGVMKVLKGLTDLAQVQAACIE
ncbi:MAG: GspE/PulE family protein [Deltaproteobacteria bacterium]|nr:GspE/PulE family protein [Deltaproteobacteria bacterium]